jgi:hypothetical protein
MAYCGAGQDLGGCLEGMMQAPLEYGVMLGLRGESRVDASVEVPSRRVPLQISDY